LEAKNIVFMIIPIASAGFHLETIPEPYEVINDDVLDLLDFIIQVGDEEIVSTGSKLAFPVGLNLRDQGVGRLVYAFDLRGMGF
jgi:hypothetical protein